MAGKKEKNQMIVIIVLVGVWGIVTLFSNAAKEAKEKGASAMGAFKQSVGDMLSKGKDLAKNYRKDIKEYTTLRDPLQKPEAVLEKEKAEQKKSEDIRKGQKIKYDRGEVEKKAAKPIDRTKYNIQGILYSDNESIAIISGEVVGEGEMVLDAKVTKIEKDKVSLSVGTQIIQIEMAR